MSLIRLPYVILKIFLLSIVLFLQEYPKCTSSYILYVVQYHGMTRPLSNAKDEREGNAEAYRHCQTTRAATVHPQTRKMTRSQCYQASSRARAPRKDTRLNHNLALTCKGMSVICL